MTADQTYAITAYVLHLNDLLDANAVLDQKTLPIIKMPNRQGFIADKVLPDVKSSRCRKDCAPEPGVKVVGLSEAALKVAEVMRFSPAYNRDKKVQVWVSLPIKFSTK